MQMRLAVLVPLVIACSHARPAETAPAPRARPTSEVNAATVEPQGTPRSTSVASVPGERGSPLLPTADAPRPDAARSLAELGDFVRARSAQLNFCYTEALSGTPKLAGSVSVAVTITSTGDVTDVKVIKRSWDGPGTKALEQCIGNKIRSWKFPRADVPVGTYPFSLSFTK
jgi:hypothetical protein